MKAALCCLALAACTGYRVAHTPHRPVDALAPPPVGYAKLCVFRASAIGAALTTPVRDNGEVVGATEGPGHFCYYASAGRHTITVQVSDAAPLVVEAVAGERYFVEHAINVGSDELVRIDATRAAHLADTTDYAVIAEVPSDEPRPALVPIATGH